MSFLLETSRLFLRELTEADAAEIFALNNDLEVLKFTGDVPFKSLEEARDFLKNYPDYQKNGFGRWAVVRKTDNEILGWCGLKRHANGMVDLGFRLHKKYWNQGFATEASKACLMYGFEELELEEITGRAEEENIASIRVLEKCGMIFSGKEFDDIHQNKEILVYKIGHENFRRH